VTFKKYGDDFDKKMVSDDDDSLNLKIFNKNLQIIGKNIYIIEL